MEQLIHPYVFLSHAHADEEYVSRLVQDLQARGIVVWIDRYDIPVGTPDWEEAIRTAIAHAAVVILVASPRARVSQVVRDELDVALLYNRFVYPFWVDGQHWIESIPLGWGRTQHLDARQSCYEAALTELATSLQKRLQSSFVPISLSSGESTIPVTAPRVSSEWFLPYRRNRFFTGREYDLQTLHEQLTTTQQVAVTQAISGLGGVGKTQLAVEYAYRFRSMYHPILWTHAETQETFLSDLANIAAFLDLPEQHEREQGKMVQAVKRWLSFHSGWLLILDNIEDLRLVEAWTPVDHHGAVLLTTRLHVTEPVAQAMELDVFSEDDGMLFLLKRAKRLTLHETLDKASTEDIVAARAITQQLGGLPLALDQASAYVAETKCAFSDYLHLFEREQRILLQRRGTVSKDHPLSVSVTFSLAFEQARQKSEASGELLKFFTFLAPDAIPEELIVSGGTHLGPILQQIADDRVTWDETLEVLLALSLIKREPSAKTVSIHRLVQTVLLDAMAEQERKNWMDRVVVALDTIFPEVDYKTWKQCERLIAHTFVCAGFASSSEEVSSHQASLLTKAGKYLYDRAQYDEAETFYLQALDIQKHLLGSEHPDIAPLLRHLAVLYDDQGQYEQAESLFRQVLHIRQQMLGAEHPEVARILNSMGGTYWHRGQYEQAEPLYLQALHILESAPEEYVIHVASTTYSLGELYLAQGQYERAEPLIQKALHLVEQVQGPEHPDLAYPLTGLANIYYEQGRYEQAEELFQRILSICQQDLGFEHPYMAMTQHNLAELYQKQGQYERAESLLRQVLPVFKRRYGLDHPFVGSALNGLAVNQTQQGQYEQANVFYQQALALREKSLGPRHIETSETLHNFAIFFHVQGKFLEAEPFYQQALDIRAQLLGPQHPHTVDTRTRYLKLLQESGQLERAAALEDISTHTTKSDSPTHISTDES